MAGIGFRLQKLVTGQSYSDLIRAYLYSALITAGPLVIVTVALASIRGLLEARLAPEERDLFMGILVYCYAFSMVGIGPYVYTTTRYLADRYYLKEIAAFTPTYLTVLKMVFIQQTILALLFLWPAQMPLHVKWMSLCLFLFITGIWIAMLFLSAARSYLWIVWAFVVGMGGGIGLAYFLGPRMGIAGFLEGFTVGQGVIFVMLTWRIFKEFGHTGTHDFGFLVYFKRHPYLVFVGLFYHLALWADKFIFWLSPHGEWIANRILLCPDYDTPSFMAYLTVIPSMAFFLVHMETSFVKLYHGYYRGLLNREPLGIIRERREAMSENLKEHSQKFILIQGVITGLIIVFIYEIASAFYLKPLQMGIFRISLLGSVLLIGFIMTLTIFFYFDFQKNAFWMAFVFCLSNIVFTAATLFIGLPAFGFGFAASCFVSLLTSVLVLNAKLRRLDYWTFMMQPILVPNFKYEGE